jgi:hypothetical protein
MKNKVATLLCIIAIPACAYSQHIQNVNDPGCKEILRKKGKSTRDYWKVGEKVIILHISCIDSTHHFFLIENKSDTLGEALNKDYPIKEKGVKIQTAGKKFFVAGRKYSVFTYRYTFQTKSWVTLQVVPPEWSTQNREDP